MSSSCCHEENTKKPSIDVLLWGTAAILVLLYGAHISGMAEHIAWLKTLAHAVHGLLHEIWWGVLLGIVMLALLSRVPREMVVALLGRKRGIGSIFRATLAGVLLDLCSHGILMVGAKLYERGASIGQVIAFLLASPWNSFSLTLILIALIGLPWTLAFIGLSAVIAIVTGYVFDRLVNSGVLPANPHKVDVPDDFKLGKAIKDGVRSADYSPKAIMNMGLQGLKDSAMVIRWLFLGIILASLIQTFVSTESLQQYFGPTLIGLFFTIVAATIIEVCSEGSTPIAADLLTRAAAPGNSFAFLMTGVSTDYTEIMVLKDTSRSWKIALFLPLISVPQIVLIGWIINYV